MLIREKKAIKKDSEKMDEIIRLRARDGRLAKLKQ